MSLLNRKIIVKNIEQCNKSRYTKQKWQYYAQALKPETWKWQFSARNFEALYLLTALCIFSDTFTEHYWVDQYIDKWYCMVELQLMGTPLHQTTSVANTVQLCSFWPSWKTILSSQSFFVRNRKQLGLKRGCISAVGTVAKQYIKSNFVIFWAPYALFWFWYQRLSSMSFIGLWTCPGQ